MPHTTETLVLDYADANDLVVDYTENLSSGRFFLGTERQFEIGTRVCLQLSCPGLRSPVRLMGVVGWPEYETDEPGVGIVLDYGGRGEQIAEMVERIRAGDPSIVTRALRILVAEDNRHVAQLIRSGLQGVSRRQFGDDLAFDFRVASNGEEALEFLQNEPFDVLIVDMYLPVLDGVHVISRVRADERLQSLPIVAVSAGGSQDKEDAVRAGADHFLAKPMRLRQITDVMRRLFDLQPT